MRRGVADFQLGQHWLLDHGEVVGSVGLQVGSGRRTMGRFVVAGCRRGWDVGTGTGEGAQCLAALLAGFLLRRQALQGFGPGLCGRCVVTAVNGA